MPWPGWTKHIFPTKAAGAKAAGGAGAAGKKTTGVKREASVSPSGADTVPDDLTCGICHDLLTGATQTPCCGGLSCNECIEAVAATTVVCPYCRARALAPGKVHTDVRVERLAANFVRACKHAGCDVKAKRDALMAHEPMCGYRPSHEVLAELRNENDLWRRQRCLQIAGIRSRVLEANFWTDEAKTDLELLSCRIHAFNHLEGPQAAPRVHLSVVHPPHMKLMPRTRAELHHSTVGVAPVIKLSHIEDQAEPTTCYIIMSCTPRSARRVTIPTKASEAVIVTGLLTEEDAVRAVNVYLAKTLGDFGLGPDGNYADPRVAQKY
jgi:hypothetical protein